MPDMKDKLSSFVKSHKNYKESKDSSDSEDSMEEGQESDTYDLACRLCEALGVSEDKADEVADILSELKSHMNVS